MVDSIVVEKRQVVKTEGGHIQSILWRGEYLELLDQRTLPHQVAYIKCTSVMGVYNAIQSMVVRGAPAISIAAAYGVVLSLRACDGDALQKEAVTWEDQVKQDLLYLMQSRPTAVNLHWVLERMTRLIETHIELGSSLEVVSSLVEEEAVSIHQADLQANFTMGQLGADYIAEASKPTPAILTHCNTGSMATGGYGTALGVIRACHSRKMIEQVYAGESRPWLQGSRLTAWELQQEAIPCSVITDSAAAYIMSQGHVGWVVVGADRVAANGDVANKIGTYALAIAAQYHKVKFMVVAPTSTFDLNLTSGDDIPIEERSASEVLQWPDGSAIAASGVKAVNPVFDITPAELIDVIVTEKGVLESPFSAEAIEALFATEPLH